MRKEWSGTIHFTKVASITHPSANLLCPSTNLGGFFFFRTFEFSRDQPQIVANLNFFRCCAPKKVQQKVQKHKPLSLVTFIEKYHLSGLQGDFPNSPYRAIQQYTTIYKDIQEDKRTYKDTQGTMYMHIFTQKIRKDIHRPKLVGAFV